MKQIVFTTRMFVPWCRRTAAFLFPAALGGIPLITFAQTPSNIVIPTSGVPLEIGGFYGFLCSAADWIFAFILVIAVIMILYAALKFLTAGGNDEAVAAARKKLTYALVGVAVALLARSLIYVVGNFIAGTQGSQGLFGC